MKTYNRRVWLNPVDSSSTSSVISFDGDVQYFDKTYRDTFLKIYDCKGCIPLHKKDTESIDEFVKKMKVLKDEVILFVNHLEKEI